MTTATPIAHDAPTEAQKKAGNYAKTHWNMHGMNIAIENLAGTKRSGVDSKGKPWEVTMPYHYGYIKGTTGADGDHLDVAVGPLMGNGTEAHIINQKGPEGEFDEHKVFIGYPSREAAIHAFKAGRSDDPDEVMGSVITVPIDELRRWIDEGCLEDEAILKSETTHVKAHYRIVNGKVVYIPNYDRAVNGDHPEATTHQRTVIGVNAHGVPFIRATDSEDRDKVLAVASSLGIRPNASRQSGTGTAGHHGRAGSYPHIYFDTSSQAHDVMDAFRVQHGDRGHEHTRAESPRRGAGAVAAEIQRRNAATTQPQTAQTAAVAAQTPEQIAQQQLDDMAARRAQASTPTPLQQPAAGANPGTVVLNGNPPPGPNDSQFFASHRAGRLDRRVYMESTVGTSNKRYVIDLRQVGEGKWVVNCGNGRNDGRMSLTVRTKTENSLSQAAANALVSQIKAEKIRGGYVVREDDASPRVSIAAMNNFDHPNYNIHTAQVASRPGTSTPAIARPTTPAPTAAPVTAATAGPTVTASEYQTVRDAAFSAGDRARRFESQHTKEALKSSLEAMTRHAIALEMATRGQIPNRSGNGPQWHADRLAAWTATAQRQWKEAMGNLNPDTINSTVSSGRGFEAAKKAAREAKDMIDLRPQGASLPAGMTEAKLAEAKAGIDKQIEDLDFGAKLEGYSAPSVPAETALDSQVAAINNKAQHMEGEAKNQALHFAGALSHLKTVYTATKAILAQHPEADDARAAAGAMELALRQVRLAPSPIWGSATKPVVDKMAELATSAAQHATRLESRPRTSDPRFSGAHESLQQAAATAHALATGTTDRGKIAAALEAHKKSAVATYHHAMTLPKGDERKAAIRKAEEHAQHARDFAKKLQGR
jgi:hypothetical protein